MYQSENCAEISIEKEMKKSYLDYAMSVIIGRALPDVRDGLKPVHRRVLYAMRELKNDWNKPYKKSARIVGDVIGKFHPHGDAAVYDTIVRLAQDFSMRYPLVDGQGNFGSVGQDSQFADQRVSRYRCGDGNEYSAAQSVGSYFSNKSPDRQSADFLRRVDGICTGA